MANYLTSRNSNIELLRILSMFGIVIGHQIWFGVINTGTSTMFSAWNEGTLVNKVFSAIMLLGSISVGVFFSITGYFQIDKEKVSVKKIIATTVFFSVVSIFIFKTNQKGHLILLLASMIFGLVLGNLGSAFIDFEKAVSFYLLGGI